MLRRRTDRRQLLLGVGSTVAATALPWAAFSQKSQVDLALVLAADCSGSVHAEHYALQQRGYGAAFSHPQVIKAIRSGIHGAIAACYFQWSGYSLQTLVVPWMVLRSDADIIAFAGRLEDANRTIFGGGTSPTGAIEFGHRLLDQCPVQPARRVLDVSGDGRNNTGPAPADARAAAVAAGIVINGLPILHMELDIDAYYEQHVIGGPGAFIVPARDYSSFETAVRRKLILEIADRAPPDARG